jgi:aldehyde:ferredoxin oxidoreductase
MVKKPLGYNGTVVRVNLSENSISTEALDELFCRRYYGGAGFVSFYLLRELAEGIDPLSPDNELIFALGPVTGVPLPGSGRACIGSKSPMTGGFGKSEVGGFWATELKRAGYDALIVEGRAESPVYIWIHDSEVSIRDAGHIWGMNVREAEETIRAELKDRLLRVAAIGPGGENLVRYACIVADTKHHAGRHGMGAVMGSKNLKAIAVRGHGRVRMANPELITELSRWIATNKRKVRFYGIGTGAAMGLYESTGMLPIHNFRDGEFPEADLISAQEIRDTIRINMEGCFACPIKCKKVVAFDEPYVVDPAYGGPEYETLAALGSNCGISDLRAICKANELCSAYSLDTLSLGGVIAFAMECFESGLLSTKDTNGLELRFGNSEAMLKLIGLIARREGIGVLLAEGTMRAAREIGGEAEKFALHVKGLELAMQEPRIKAGHGLGFAINPQGADHGTNVHDEIFATIGEPLDRFKPLGILEPLPSQDLSPHKVSLARYVQQIRFVLDSLVLCQFLPYDPEQLAQILSAVTGWKTGVVEMLKVGERIVTLARMFNIREGFTSADDTLPERFFQPKKTSTSTVRPVDRGELERAKRYYYALMGWDPETGIPLQEKLEELDIAWAEPRDEHTRHLGCIP